MDEPGNGRAANGADPSPADPSFETETETEAEDDRDAGRESVERLIALIGPRIDEARAAVTDVVSRWRGDATRATERAGASLHGVLRELGLVLRTEYEELELRVAQLEHRLKLLERDDEIVPPSAPTV